MGRSGVAAVVSTPYCLGVIGISLEYRRRFVGEGLWPQVRMFIRKGLLTQSGRSDVFFPYCLGIVRDLC